MRNTNTVVVQNKIVVVKERSEQFKYQRLCRLAKRVLCATVTTAGVERVFSTAGFIVSSRRTLLGDCLNLCFLTRWTVIGEVSIHI